MQILIDLVHQKDIAMEQAVKAAKTLYTSSPKDSEEQRQTLQMLWQLTQNERVTADQHLYILAVPIAAWNGNYLDKAQALEKLFALLPEDQITNYVEEHWPYRFSDDIQPHEIPYMIAIAKQQLLPLRVRDDTYYLLSQSVPKFDKIPPSDDTITL